MVLTLTERVGDLSALCCVMASAIKVKRAHIGSGHSGQCGRSMQKAGFLPVACYPCHADDLFWNSGNRRSPDRQRRCHAWVKMAPDASGERSEPGLGVRRVQRLLAYTHQTMCAAAAETGRETYAIGTGGARGDCGD